MQQPSVLRLLRQDPPELVQDTLVSCNRLYRSQEKNHSVHEPVRSLMPEPGRDGGGTNDSCSSFEGTPGKQEYRQLRRQARKQLTPSVLVIHYALTVEHIFTTRQNFNLLHRGCQVQPFRSIVEFQRFPVLDTSHRVTLPHLRKCERQHLTMLLQIQKART